MKTYIICLLTCLCPLVSDAGWTSTDGKTIEAQFVRVEGEIVILKMGKKVFNVPLERLDAESRKDAVEQQQAREKKFKEQLAAETIGEADLLWMIDFDPKQLEGKRYKVNCSVAKIDRASLKKKAGDPVLVDVVTEGGTAVQVDVTEKTDEPTHRTEIRGEEVVVQRMEFEPASFDINGKALSYKEKGFMDYVILLKVGETYVVNATVTDGKIVGSQMVLPVVRPPDPFE